MLTMSSVSVAVTLLCACVIIAHAQKQYTDRFDNVDIDKILSSRRLVNNYVQCMVGKRPCPPEAAELKKNLPEAIRTKCSKCTDSQRNIAVKVVSKMQKDYPAEWKTVMDKWDPKGTYIKEFEQEIEKLNKKG